ncbi:MAG: UDP-N-acetylglucosamine 1-carboxyvinyltransferase [Oscillatoriales cyanobacterium]|nr:MAG: UDP-N-acetylglucosamine 1-carboxyvinyltransferase [Oscillatoriales cyanobacterium]
MEGKIITPAQNSSNLSASPESDQQVLQIWGRQPLKGQVKISGAKNSALVVMAGALLCPDDCHIRNVPALVDVARMGQILSAVGVKVQQNGDVLDMNASNLIDAQAPYELVSQLRASFFIIGPLLARLGFAKVPLPGGCAIVKGPNRRLKGAKIYLDYPSVGATETLMMAATLAEGETVIENAAQEPEVVDLANFCRAMGAKIQGAGTNTIVISGVEKLHAVDYAIIPDRIEAGTFLLAGAITHSEITLSSVIPDHLTAVIAKLQTMGAKIIVESDTVRIIPGKIHTATDIETLPYPGFSTDMQAPFMALLTLSEGDSMIKETVFENRLRHVAELNRMGADIRVKGNVAVVRGVPMLSGAPVVATDLRASAALVIAGLAADGVTTISSLQHLDRGYEQLEMKLQKLGAKLRRVKEGTDPANAEFPVNPVR